MIVRLSSPSPARRAWPLAALLIVSLAACGDDDGPARDAGPDSGSMEDAGRPDARPVDAGMTCVEDEDCDDGVECTRDRCDDRGICRNLVDLGICDDGIFCNGVEQCDPLEGCVPGPIQTCTDDDVCTIDRCDEEAKLCRYSPRDFDEDGEADINCEGGTDCDDRDATRGSTVAEICDDGVDNDCDEVTDEADCGRPMYDVCEDPLDVSAGGFFELSSEGAAPDYDLECAPSGRKDLVLTFTIEEPQALTVRAEGRSITYVELRTECGDGDTAEQCASGFPGTLRARSLEPGTYFVLVADVGGDLAIEVVFEDPRPAPPNESCDMPTDVSAGGAFRGSFVDVADDVDSSCGSSRAPDLLYEFTLEEERDAVLSAVSDTGDSLSLSVSTTCGDEASELRCVRGPPAGTRLHQLPPGTYFITVEGSTSREPDFTLDVAFEDPTPPPAGDTCGNPLTITPGETVTGTLADKQDDLDISCGFNFRDVVYELELTERSDLTVIADADGPFMYVSIRDGVCDEGSAQLRCTSGNPSRSRIRDLAPGTYYLIVESFSGTGYTLEVQATEPTTPVDVSGNENCTTAYAVPSTGGLFRGDTTTALNDYETRSCGSGAASNDVVFRVDLIERQRVTASTDGSSFDTVLHLHSGECMSEGETACDDDGGEGSTSYLERELDPGSHYFIVDGWGSSNAGEYLFEVTISDP